MTVISAWWRSNMPFQILSGRLNYYITRSRQEVSELKVRWVRDKMWLRKPPPSRRGPRDPRLSWRLDELETRCGRESQHPAESGPPGLRLSSPGERERHNADGHKSGGQYIAVSVRSPTPSHTQTFQIKWEVNVFKEVFTRLYSLRQYIYYVLSIQQINIHIKSPKVHLF